ncbi:MAG TPA: hypothetical protein VIH89_05490 [Candidatus Sulfotelmatobacter sp.]
MPRLPAFDPSTRVNESPHVVILGAGASRAALPDGDAKGRRLPLMADLVDCLELRPAIQAAGFPDDGDFESIYDELATSGRCPSLKGEIESRVRSYFGEMQLPEVPTLYDYLLLSLRDKDCIASFNWDPFLAKAFIRNRAAAALPRILFLHVNVAIGACSPDHTKDFMGNVCPKCRGDLQPTKLLYPVRQKDYRSDPFIEAEWKELEASLKNGYMLTIFGYGAPATDVEAVDLMLRGWGQNPTFELAQVAIVDTKPQEQLEKTWERFLCRAHYGTSPELWETWLLRHPRRSCEALTMATLQNDPWRSNPFPRFKSLSQLHAWIAPLVTEEDKGRFTGNPCLQPEDFSEAQPQTTRKMASDWVLGWLKNMCVGEIIPPFCVELVLKDGTRYHLHSILELDDQTRTLCARIWDLRAFHAEEIDELKQRLNQIRTRNGLAPAERVHPKLDWANLHLHYEDVAYCVEWHDRIWPDAKRTRQIGDTQPAREEGPNSLGG